MVGYSMKLGHKRTVPMKHSLPNVHRSVQVRIEAGDGISMQ